MRDDLAVGLLAVVVAEAVDADEDERIEIVTVPLAELDDAIRGCRDAKSLAGLLWFRAFER